MNQQSSPGKWMLLKKFLTNPDRKPLWKIIMECLYLTILYRTLPRHYFGRLLFKKEITNIKDFIPNPMIIKLTSFFNEREVIEVQENKHFFDLYYGQLGLRLPKILMYNYRNIFVIDNKPIRVNSSNDFFDVLKNLFISKELNSIFIKGTYWTYSGNNIYKIFAHQFMNERHKIDALYAAVIKTGYLFQETIQQHQEMDRLNPSCINSIRMDTFIDCDGNIEIMSGYLRFSIRNSHVDNISQGGCMVYIDLESGRLRSEGHVGFRKGAGEVIKSHPVTHVVFENFEIPFFDQAKKMIIQ